jgi:hypothetical protein
MGADGSAINNQTIAHGPKDAVLSRSIPWCCPAIGLRRKCRVSVATDGGAAAGNQVAATVCTAGGSALDSRELVRALVVFPCRRVTSLCPLLLGAP